MRWRKRARPGGRRRWAAEQRLPAAALQAAWWYYGQGYLFDAADIIDKNFRSAGGSPLGTSPLVVELGALVATYQALLDLRSAAETPTAALPPGLRCKGRWRGAW